MHEKEQKDFKKRTQKSSKKFRTVGNFLQSMDENVKINMFFKVQSCNCLEHNGGNSLQT